MAYPFHKSGYKSEDKIQTQYESHILCLLNGRSEGDLDTKEKEIFGKLRHSSMLDPRIPIVGFGIVGEGIVASIIADKLDKMTDKEFAVSPFVYTWFDDLKTRSIFRGESMIAKVMREQAKRQIEDQVIESIASASGLQERWYETKPEDRLNGPLKYFNVDFGIGPDDDFRMVSEINSNGKEFVHKYIKKECIDPHYFGGSIILFIGETSMLVAYILTKLGYSDRLSKIREKICRFVADRFLKKGELDLVVVGGIADMLCKPLEFYDHCIEFGQKMAKGPMTY